MQVLALIALASVAVANPTLRQLAGTTKTPTGSAGCYRYSAPRQCGLGGDRVMTCIDYENICEPNWTSPFNSTDADANRESCAGSETGYACTAVWTCCPPSA